MREAQGAEQTLTEGLEKLPSQREDGSYSKAWVG